MINGTEETCKRAPLRIRPPEELLADWGFEGAWAREGGMCMGRSSVYGKRDALSMEGELAGTEDNIHCYNSL
jgi:hypothetical protein